jgi:hypothetical protein
MCFQWEEEAEKHRMMPKRTVSQIRPDTGPKCFFSISSFFKQSMDGPGSFKPVAGKIPPQLPTLLMVNMVLPVPPGLLVYTCIQTSANFWVIVNNTLND